jgi:hypothetical protein
MVSVTPHTDEYSAYPKQQSNILANMKQENGKGPRRALKLVKHFEQIDQLRDLRRREQERIYREKASGQVKGSIIEKDLTLEVQAQDWPHLCNENHKLYKAERQRAADLAKKMSEKQKEYIFREQEYKRTI